MTVDRTKLNLYSTDNTFKNNRMVPGSFTISGNHTAGTNIKTFTIDLGSISDMVSIQFNGPADPIGIDPRPAIGWFRNGAAYEQSPDGGGGFPVWMLNSSISGSVVTITATYIQQYSGTYVSTPTVVSYRIVDNSAF